MSDVNEHIKRLERAIVFGSLKKEDLSPDERSLLEEHQNANNKAREEKAIAMETEKQNRFISSILPHLPAKSKNIKILGGNWFSFELEKKRFMLYYYYPMNMSLPVFSCLTEIKE